MKLSLKGSPRRGLPQEYRGTDREFPCYVIEVKETHEANQAYFLYLNSKKEDDFLHDITVAREIVKGYKTLTHPESYEIIEVTEGKGMPESTENLFLGYDLSCNGYSLVASFITQYRESGKRPWEKGVPRHVILFDRLIEKHFKPKLNQYFLFDSYETSVFCLECMMAILELAPQFYEPGEYKVVGIYKII